MAESEYAVVTTVLQPGTTALVGEEVKKPDTMVDQFEIVSDPLRR